MQQRSKKKPQLVLFLLDNERSYKQYKRFLIEQGVVSQMVGVRTANAKSLSVASNILKQMNAKLGLDNYRMKIPKEISKYTMMVGIDVCHKSRKSIVGFCSTIN